MKIKSLLFLFVLFTSLQASADGVVSGAPSVSLMPLSPALGVSGGRMLVSSHKVNYDGLETKWLRPEQLTFPIPHWSIKMARMSNTEVYFSKRKSFSFTAGSVNSSRDTKYLIKWPYLVARKRVIDTVLDSSFKIVSRTTFQDVSTNVCNISSGSCQVSASQISGCNRPLFTIYSLKASHINIRGFSKGRFKHCAARSARIVPWL